MSAEPGAREVLESAAYVTRVLSESSEDDWRATVPHLTWTVSQTVAHAARSAVWCGIDLAVGGPDLHAVELDVSTAVGPAELLRTVLGAARLTAHVIDAAPPGALGFDSGGPADASGFAGMCCDELLIHGWDAARALGVTFEPGHDLAATVLARLFPWQEAEPDPWSALLWSNGRIALPGRPRQDHWTWQVAVG